MPVVLGNQPDGYVLQKPTPVTDSEGQSRRTEAVLLLLIPTNVAEPGIQMFARSVVSTTQIKYANKKSIWHDPLLLFRSICN